MAAQGFRILSFLRKVKTRMALVLCTGVNLALLETRKYILERAGHTVVTVRDEPTLLAACQRHSFNVAVIGQTTGKHSKKRIWQLVRENCAEAKVLVLYEPLIGPVLNDADAHLATPVDVPTELVDTVNELAKRAAE